ncbi:UDP-glucoronosyl and UDP-glucosyl transferase domain-containing protein [Ditylenchus destructor]|nr:UDP-glucoronosyl and UDP-glucosyl transferase domain-containing protein [Ditylenchus destructor]
MNTRSGRKGALIKDKALIESLRAENFDAIFVEHLYPFGTALGQALGIRTHFLTNTMPLVEYLTDVFGIPLPTGYVPVVANVDFSDQMTILERAENIFQTWIISKLFHDYFDATTAIFRRHWDPNFGDMLEYMRSSTPLIFVAVSEFMDFPLPIMEKKPVVQKNLAKGDNPHRMTEKEEDEELLQQAKQSDSLMTFNKSPYYINNGQMRDYQICGLNWLIQLQ